MRLSEHRTLAARFIRQHPCHRIEKYLILARVKLQVGQGATFSIPQPARVVIVDQSKNPQAERPPRTARTLGAANCSPWVRILPALLLLLLGFCSSLNASDLGSTDILRLSMAAPVNGETVVSVHVINDQPLAALDIPIRFGQPGDPTELLRVDFEDRVENWDFTHAEINNQNKTVIIGMIASVGRLDERSDLANSTVNESVVARMVFEIGSGYTPTFTTFTTQRPEHDLTFLYYTYRANGADVLSFKPQFEIDNAAAKITTLPTDFALSGNFPNPFNAATEFTLSMPQGGDYDIRIFNVMGQQVRVFRGQLEAGTHAFKWDGRSDEGQAVASGVYFYRAKVGRQEETRMMMLLK